MCVKFFEARQKSDFKKAGVLSWEDECQRKAKIREEKEQRILKEIEEGNRPPRVVFCDIGSGYTIDLYLKEQDNVDYFRFIRRDGKIARIKLKTAEYVSFDDTDFKLSDKEKEILMEILDKNYMCFDGGYFTLKIAYNQEKGMVRIDDVLKLKMENYTGDEFIPVDYPMPDYFKLS